MKVSARRDILGGLAVVAVGTAFAVSAAHLRIGTITNMGGGYFPLAVAVLTILFGAVIALRAFLMDRGARPDNIDESGEAPNHPIAWRAALSVLSGVALFGLCLTYLGFIPAVFACALASARADPTSRSLETLIIAGITACVCWAVFVYGLEISAPAFAWAL